MKLIFEKLQRLFEMPWVTVGDKVIDLEFEKLRSKPAIMARIKSEVDKIPEKWDKIDFINSLFSDFWAMMNHYDIHKDEVQALVPEEPEEIYEDAKKAN